MRSLVLEDFSRLVLLGAPRMRSDGESIAFRAGRADLDANSYDYRVWGTSPSGEPSPLTRGPRDGNPSWEPRGRRFLFIRNQENADEIVMWTPDGEEFTVLRWKNGIRRVEWASKGVAVATLNEGEEDDGIRTIKTIPFWENGEGWTYWYLTRLYGIDVRTGEAWPISPEGLHVTDFMPSPDGKKVAFLALKDKSKPLDVSLFISDLEGSVEEIGDGSWYLIMVSWIGDSRALGVVGHDKGRGLVTNRHLYETPVDKWDPVDLVRIDRSVGNRLNSDVRGGMDQRPKWMDGKWYFTLHDRGSVNLYRTEGNGIEVVVGGEVSIEGFDVANGRIVVTAMTSDSPAELYLVSNGELEPLTDLNEGFRSRVKLAKPRRFSFTASDGVEVEGWFLAPDGEGPHLTVLYVHGGPATAFGSAFMHELHFLRDSGYGVLMVNPRGSEGYGEDFRDIRRRYGERDYQDLMEALDEAIRRGWADPERLAVAGGSYGGFMTNWIIGHTDRFKAAITMRSISNWISDYGTTDIGFYFNPDQIGDTPWENFQVYWEKSPLAYVGNMKTPTLIIHSTEDYRCWLDQALQLFTALKVRGIETELVLFPGENHDLSRKGKPKHRVERLKKIVTWLDKYLRGS
ncbi:MAG: S9 family peptidase [Candidatus Korarchaeota archaeon]|nr:S9 family peptidase [Candidatus Korarchaeota archaeon]